MQNPNKPPEKPHLHRSKQSEAQILSIAYWRELCPDLHVCDAAFQQSINKMNLTTFNRDDSISRMNEEGYFDLHSSKLQWDKAISFDTLAQNVVKLMQYGWPPSFLSMYDEIWALVYQMSQVLTDTTQNQMNMDLLIWYIDPNNQESGFSPHRDRQPDDSPATFRKDGSAMYTTCWIPFTDACPENSCLYVIPRWADPGYFEGDDENANPLEVALSSKEQYQNIRCIPLTTGSAVIFTHRIIHWGSRGRKGYPTPRIACSFAFADDQYEQSYISRSNLPYPGIELRLSLISAQMLIYYQRFSFSASDLAQYYQFYSSQKVHFERSYCEKVEYEFVQSAKETSSRKTENDDSDDDLLDSALDLMLDAQLSNADAFNDDFDELSDCDPVSAESEEDSEEEPIDFSTFLPSAKKQKPNE